MGQGHLWAHQGMEHPQDRRIPGHPKVWGTLGSRGTPGHTKGQGNPWDRDTPWDKALLGTPGDRGTPDPTEGWGILGSRGTPWDKGTPDPTEGWDTPRSGAPLGTLRDVAPQGTWAPLGVYRGTGHPVG